MAIVNTIKNTACKKCHMFRINQPFVYNCQCIKLPSYACFHGYLILSAVTCVLKINNCCSVYFLCPRFDGYALNNMCVSSLYCLPCL